MRLVRAVTTAIVQPHLFSRTAREGWEATWGSRKVRELRLTATSVAAEGPLRAISIVARVYATITYGHAMSESVSGLHRPTMNGACMGRYVRLAWS